MVNEDHTKRIAERYGESYARRAEENEEFRNVLLEADERMRRWERELRLELTREQRCYVVTFCLTTASDGEIKAAREMTREEARDEYFRTVWEKIEILAERHDRDGADVRDTLMSLAFRMFTTLEGAGRFCYCRVVPEPHPMDRVYARLSGRNWFPSGGRSILNGEDHHVFVAMDPRDEEEPSPEEPVESGDSDEDDEIRAYAPMTIEQWNRLCRKAADERGQDRSESEAKLTVSVDGTAWMDCPCGNNWMVELGRRQTNVASGRSGEIDLSCPSCKIPYVATIRVDLSGRNNRDES